MGNNDLHYFLPLLTVLTTASKLSEIELRVNLTELRICLCDKYVKYEISVIRKRGLVEIIPVKDRKLAFSDTDARLLLHESIYDYRRVWMGTT